MATYSEVIPTRPGFYVYRLWAADGTCLYVGRTGDNGPRPVQVRLNHHRRTKPWWPEVARIEAAELPDHPAIVGEEAEQIRTLRPPHNSKRGNCGHDLALPGAVIPTSGRCRQCARQYDNRSPAKAAYEASPARKAKRRENERRRLRIRPSGSTRAAIAKRSPSAGQEGLWAS